jgi:hypothetical protein
MLVAAKVAVKVAASLAFFREQYFQNALRFSGNSTSKMLVAAKVAAKVAASLAFFREQYFQNALHFWKY